MGQVILADGKTAWSDNVFGAMTVSQIVDYIDCEQYTEDYRITLINVLVRLGAKADEALPHLRTIQTNKYADGRLRRSAMGVALNNAIKSIESAFAPGRKVVVTATTAINNGRAGVVYLSNRQGVILSCASSPQTALIPLWNVQFHPHDGDPATMVDREYVYPIYEDQMCVSNERLVKEKCARCLGTIDVLIRSEFPGPLCILCDPLKHDAAVRDAVGDLLCADLAVQLTQLGRRLRNIFSPLVRMIRVILHLEK